MFFIILGGTVAFALLTALYIHMYLHIGVTLYIPLYLVFLVAIFKAYQQYGFLASFRERKFIFEYQNAVKSYGDVLALCDAYGQRLSKQMKFIQTCGTILITLGLLGTVMGLITSINGMDAGITEKVHQLLSGLKFAFLTTLIGSLFGGVLLRIILSYLQGLIDSEVDVVAEQLIALIKKRTTECRTGNTSQFSEIEQKLRDFYIALDNVVENLESLVDMTIDKRASRIAEAFEQQARLIRKHL